MGNFYLLIDIWFTFDAYNFLNNLQFTPFAIDKIVGTLGIEFLLPKVAIVDHGRSLAPAQVLRASDSDAWQSYQ